MISVSTASFYLHSNNVMNCMFFTQLKTTCQSSNTFLKQFRFGLGSSSQLGFSFSFLFPTLCFPFWKIDPLWIKSIHKPAEATKVSVGDNHPKQLEDRTIPVWDCLKPLAGFSSCVASLKHPNLPHTQLRLQQMALEGGPSHHV